MNEHFPQKENIIAKVRPKVKFTNLDKVFWPKEGYRKGDVIEYYNHISDILLPYLNGRPESLRRNPNGIEDDGFFQKNMESVPAWVKTEKIYSQSNNKDINYLVCNDRETLLYMANLGCIEINPWSSRINRLENPDYAIIDIDPNEAPMSSTVKVARKLHEILNNIKAKHFLKTSGGRGLHIFLPLGAGYNYAQASDFIKLIGLIINKIYPDITSLETSPAKRVGKVHIDYRQNNKGQTVASVYSLRPKQGATVSTPLQWEELEDNLDPKIFNIKSIFPRLEKIGDLFKGVLADDIDMDDSMLKLAKYIK